MSHKNNFDLIRLLAALQVMVYHTMAHLHVAPLPGWPTALFGVLRFFPGVPIFFVISGFLISASWERNPNFRSYWVNRILRIYPAMLVCLAVSISLMLAFKGIALKQLATIPFLGWLLAQMTIGQTLNIGMFRHYGVGNPNGSLWTIPVELEFYALLPVLHLVGAKIRSQNSLLLVVVAGSVAVDLLYPASDSGLGRLLHFTVIPNLWVFGLGILIQTHFDSLRRFLEGKAAWWLLCYIPVASLLDRFVGTEIVSMLSEPILALAVISIAFKIQDAAKTLLRRIDFSFGIYLCHMIWTNVAIQGNAPISSETMEMVNGTTMASAMLTWFFVERRFRKARSATPFQNIKGRLRGFERGAATTKKTLVHQP